MKKIILSIAVLGCLAMGFSSCKTHEKCPAYSYIDLGVASGDQE